MRFISAVVALFAISNAMQPDSVTVYFIRHGDSVWNQAKRDKSGYAGSKALRHLGLSWVTGKEQTSSPYLVKGVDRLTDAPLTTLGHEQSIALGKAVFNSNEKVQKELADSILGGEVIFAASNLVRTQQTLANVLNQRASKSEVTVNVLNFLQELSGEIDARSSKTGRSMSGTGKMAIAEALRADAQFKWVIPGQQGDNDGTIQDLNEQKQPLCNRLQTFGKWLSSKVRTQGSPNKFLIAGHSSWLLALYNFALVANEQSMNLQERILQRKKLGNASMIKFVFEFVYNGSQYVGGHIVPSSTVTVYDDEESLSPPVPDNEKAIKKIGMDTCQLEPQ